MLMDKILKNPMILSFHIAFRSYHNFFGKDLTKTKVKNNKKMLLANCFIRFYSV